MTDSSANGTRVTCDNMIESDIMITRDRRKVDAYVITTDGTPNQSVPAIVLSTLAEAIEARGWEETFTCLQALRDHEATEEKRRQDAPADADEAAAMDEANAVSREEYLAHMTRGEVGAKILATLSAALDEGLKPGTAIAEANAALRDLYDNNASPAEVWECFTDGAYAPQPGADRKGNS